MDPITYLIVQIVIAVIATVASTIISQQQQDSSAPEQREPGVSGTSRTGEGPATFIIGKYATPGQLINPLSCWTADATDATPNEFLVGVYGVSMLPVRGFQAPIVNNQEVTLLTEEEHEDYGYPAEEYRDDDDVDHLWFKFYDGTQTGADPYLRDKFGSHPDRPWRSTAVGAGIAYVIVTARANREFFPSFPKYKFVVDGIELNDTRGDDEHENNIVAVRTIMSGLSYDGQWFYGPQDVHANMLPTAQWEPEMDKCDQLITRKGGGSDKRYRCGMEITVTEQSIDIVNELLKGCAGRITYAGCQYKVLVGAAGSSVNSITEADILVDHTQELDQFPEGMQGVHNGIRGEYICPEEAWNYKDAPVRVDSDYVAEDDGRELFHNVRYRSVWDNRQAQRLMKLALKDGRKFRRHVYTLGPEFFAYEPLDVIDLTLTAEQYEEKEFLITAKEDLPDGTCIVGLHEIDATDYDWEPDDDEDDFTFTVTSQSRPPAQTAASFAVQPGFNKDENGNNWRPSIEASFAGGLRDVRAIRIQARIEATGAVVFDGVFDYDPSVSSPSVLLPGQFKPNTLHEARGKFLPFGKRRTSWSSWLEVTTPDVRINNSDFSDDVKRAFRDLRQTLQVVLDNDQIEIAESMIEAVNARLRALDLQHRSSESHARVSEETTARQAADTALASRVTTTEASINQNAASIVTVEEAIVTESEARATAISQLEADVEGTYAAITYVDQVISTEQQARATAISQIYGELETNYATITEIDEILVEKDYASATSVTQLEADIGLTYATIVSQDQVVVDLTEAIADSVTALESKYFDQTAQGIFQIKTSATQDNAQTTIALLGRVNENNTFRESGLFINVTNDEGWIALKSDKLFLLDQNDDIQIIFDVDGKLGYSFIPNIKANRLDVDDLSSIAADLGTVTTGRLRSSDEKWDFDLRPNRNRLRYDGNDIIEVVDGNVQINADLLRIGRATVTEGVLPSVRTDDTGSMTGNSAALNIMGEDSRGIDISDAEIFQVTAKVLVRNTGQSDAIWQWRVRTGSSSYENYDTFIFYAGQPDRWVTASFTFLASELTYQDSPIQVIRANSNVSVIKRMIILVQAYYT